MTDLERLFRQIVTNLSASDPTRLREPLSLAEIRDSIVPYRAYRRPLQLESSEDYELALMRLCAGEGGFAHTEPEQIQEEFAAELRSPNPDLTLVHRHEKSLVSLAAAALTRVMDREPDRSYAPPKDQPEPRTKPPEPKAASDPLREEDPHTRCTRCRATLPTGRGVKFCPQCGINLALRRCAQCNAELEPHWKHCVDCGAAVIG